MDSKSNFLKSRGKIFVKNDIFLLLVIGVIGIFLRFYYLPLDIPFLSDALLYFSYANDLNFLDKFPTGYNFSNNGWPTFLGFIFNFFPNYELIEFMNIQRITSVVISTLTIFPLYYFLRNFFPKYISLLGLCIFLFEPRIIINSVLGITDPLYIFLITTSLATFFHKNKNYVYLSFICIAISILVRYEGIIWLFTFSILFFISNKKRIDYKLFLKYGIILVLTFSIIFPMMQIRTETMGSDQIIPVLQDSIKSVDTLADGDNKIISIILFFGNGIVQLFKYLTWIMIPYLFVFIPLGVIFAIKKKDNQTKFLIFSVIMVLSTSILYAYSRGIQDTRYLYPLYPIFIVFGLYFVERIFENVRNKKIVTIIIVFGILISSIFFLEEKSIDIEHESEAIQIMKNVNSITNIINKFDHESGYIHTNFLLEQNVPILLSDLRSETRTISYNNDLKLDEFIKNNYENGTHIVIDNKNERPSFFKQLIKNDNSFEYLEKVYDSKDVGFDYHVKVFEINFDKLK